MKYWMTAGFYASVACYAALFFVIYGDVFWGWDFCQADETVGLCARAWVGALSGWFAAMAAAATMYVLWGQLSEARRQTRFVVGDAEPTAELSTERGELATVRLVVTNWNRRKVVIESIEPAPGLHFGGFHGSHETGIMGNFPDGRMWEVDLDGWVDRREPPKHAQITFMATTEESGLTPATHDYDFRRRRIAAKITLRVVGAVHERVTLDVETPDHYTL